eukprot:gene14121-biopygen23095
MGESTGGADGASHRMHGSELGSTVSGSNGSAAADRARTTTTEFRATDAGRTRATPGNNIVPPSVWVVGGVAAQGVPYEGGGGPQGASTHPLGSEWVHTHVPTHPPVPYGTPWRRRGAAALRTGLSPSSASEAVRLWGGRGVGRTKQRWVAWVNAGKHPKTAWVGGGPTTRARTATRNSRKVRGMGGGLHQHSKALPRAVVQCAALSPAGGRGMAGCLEACGRRRCHSPEPLLRRGGKAPVPVDPLMEVPVCCSNSLGRSECAFLNCFPTAGRRGKNDRAMTGYAGTFNGAQRCLQRQELRQRCATACNGVQRRATGVRRCAPVFFATSADGVCNGVQRCATVYTGFLCNFGRRCMRRCAPVCAGVRRCAPVCAGVHRCAPVSTGVQRCATVCTGVQRVHQCAPVCTGVRRCAPVCTATVNNGVQRCAPVFFCNFGRRCMQRCATVCNGEQRCAPVCTGVQRCAPVCTGVHRCAPVCNGVQ